MRAGAHGKKFEYLSHEHHDTVLPQLRKRLAIIEYSYILQRNNPDQLNAVILFDPIVLVRTSFMDPRKVQSGTNLIPASLCRGPSAHCPLALGAKTRASTPRPLAHTHSGKLRAELPAAVPAAQVPAATTTTNHTTHNPYRGTTTPLSPLSQGVSSEDSLTSAVLSLSLSHTHTHTHAHTRTLSHLD